MSLGSGTTPLDWYSKSQDKKLRELDALYQEILDQSIPDYHGLSLKEEARQYNQLCKKYRKLAQLRKVIGFITK